MDIDFVVMWVDGNDPAWLAEKNKYSSNIISDANSVKRYRDWNLMKYWFRAIEEFTPWVHNVYFVTWGHLPEFLNPDAPKLRIVKHSDFMPSKYLPTFNSTVIETNLFRIEDLSEHFVLFNDDMFIIRPMDDKSFFKNDLPCAYYSEVPFSPNLLLGTFQYHGMNSVSLINNNFDKKKCIALNWKKYYSNVFPLKDRIRTAALDIIHPDAFSYFKNFHSPAAYLKSTFKEIWDKEFDFMDCSSREKFRTEKNVNQYVGLYWQLASGMFEPAKIDNVLYSITDISIDEICQNITLPLHDMICLNDGKDLLDFDMLSDRLISTFESILPDKSGFEK